MQRVRPRAALSVLLTTVAVCMLPGCATTVAGNAVSVFDDPFKVGGLQAVDGPSGLRPDAEKPTRKVTDGNGGQIDKIAVQSVSDIEAHGEFAFPKRSTTARSNRSRLSSRGTPTPMTACSATRRRPVS